MKVKKDRVLFEPFNLTITVENEEEFQLLTDLFEFNFTVPKAIYTNDDDARRGELTSLMEILAEELVRR